MIEKYQSILDKLNEIIHLIFLDLSPSDLTLADVADIKYGRGLEASKLVYDMKYPVYGSNGIIGTLNIFDFEEPKIAISCRGASSGNVLLTKPFSTISSNSLFLNFKSNNDTLPIYSYLKRIGLSAFATGSAQPQITIENIQHLKVPELTKQSKNTNFLMDLLFITQSKIDYAQKIKTFLLNKYF